MLTLEHLAKELSRIRTRRRQDGREIYEKVLARLQALPALPSMLKLGSSKINGLGGLTLEIDSFDYVLTPWGTLYKKEKGRRFDWQESELVDPKEFYTALTIAFEQEIKEEDTIFRVEQETLSTLLSLFSTESTL